MNKETALICNKEIKKRRKQFFAFCLALILGLMPTLTVWAADIEYNLGSESELNGKSISSGEKIKCTVGASGGKLIVYYVKDGNSIGQEEADISGDATGEITVADQGITDLDYWKVSEAKNDGTESKITLEAVINTPPPVPDEPAQHDKKKTDHYEPGRNGNEKEEEEEWEDPAKLNPDALGAFYYKNGLLDTKAKFGKQEQGVACTAAFDLAKPYGWKNAFFFSMTYEDKHTYSMKDGTLILAIPGQYQKPGRQYAVMAIDKNAVVHLYQNKGNTVKIPYIFTNKLDFEGYAFCLIYKD